MPMVMVDPKVYAARDGSAVPPVVARMEKNYSLAGIGLGLDCQWDDSTNQFVGDCEAYGATRDDGGQMSFVDPAGSQLPSVAVPTPANTPVGTKVLQKGDPGWANAFNLLTKTFSQVLLNNNQAIVMRTNKDGTTVYQSTGGTSANAFPGGQALATGVGLGLGSTGYLMIGGAALLVVMMMSRQR